ncbi:fused MFS/spermidine synthase [Erwinia sp. S38]|uniref:fused MFS/spermidine synthase n=1 Tax=Erwinia sp. S38 TaxID=2769338 RepID=UPI00190C6409|nr:fused MFS/spermidine synthase [Erwinia sp. S38]MBK0000194.1 fused MFS/spermidine synthase [Erwinia sp. S38]
MTDVEQASSVSIFRIRGDIVTSASDEHGQITVIENKIYRILTFDRMCEQSKMQKSDPALPVHNYIRAMLMAVALKSPQKALILGLGGGCLPRAIAARDAACAMDIVELRPAVIDVARQHFSLPEGEHIHYHAVDADKFLASATGNLYDLIFSDLYAADTMSPLQEMETFLQHAKRTLKTDGWLVLNYPQRPAANGPLLQALQRQFSTLLRCVVPSGNVVIYASNVTFDLPLRELQRIAIRAGNEFGTDFSSLTPKLAVLSGRQP